MRVELLLQILGGPGAPPEFLPLCRNPESRPSVSLLCGSPWMATRQLKPNFPESELLIHPKLCTWALLNVPISVNSLTIYFVAQAKLLWVLFSHFWFLRPILSVLTPTCISSLSISVFPQHIPNQAVNLPPIMHDSISFGSLTTHHSRCSQWWFFL